MDIRFLPLKSIEFLRCSLPPDGTGLPLSDSFEGRWHQVKRWLQDNAERPAAGGHGPDAAR